MRHNVGKRSEGNIILPQEIWNLRVSLQWVLHLHLVCLLRSPPVWSRKMNDRILHPDICFICRTPSPYTGFTTDEEGKLLRISCSYNDSKSLKSEIPSPFLHLSAIHQLSHLSISWHFLLSALMWLNLWYIVRGFSQWQDYKMPDASLLVPLKLPLNMFLFDTNYSWSVGGKPDPIDSSNCCESWEVNSSFRIWHKNLASNQANFLFIL